MIRARANTCLASEGTIRRIAVSSACGLNSHVRLSTLLSIPQALSLHFIRILPSDKSDAVTWRPALSKPHSAMRSRTTKYAPFCGRGFFAHLIQMTASDYGRRERASWSTTSSLSKTVSRAAQPSVHRRCNRLLNAAARPATSQAGRKIK